MKITEKRINQIFDNFESKKFAIIGDLMLDRYFWGSVNRISPEAPVPIVEIESESMRLGGAANVANNIKSLGCIPVLLGVLGDDQDAKILLSISKELGFDISGIMIDETRPTTTKTRVIAEHQHVVRIDKEDCSQISQTIQDNIIDFIRRNISDLNGIIFQDYNKGVIGKRIIEEIVKIATDHNKIISVDPKFSNFFDYQNVTVFKPNRKETEEVLGIKISDEDSLEKAGKKIQKELNAENVIITRGEKGMAVFGKDGIFHKIPTTARKVADVSGAGDTVISTLTIAISSGASIQEAAVMANTAGGIVCGEVGIIPIDKTVLFETLLEDINHL